MFCSFMHSIDQQLEPGPDCMQLSSASARFRAGTAPENADPSSQRPLCASPTLCDCVLPGIGDWEGRQALHAFSIQTVSCDVARRHTR
jgi:hypothetical protein